jgi:hypothetical protein
MRRASARTSKGISPDGNAGGPRIRANSLYFPVDQGIRGAETGSRWTTSSANQSATPENLRAEAEPTRRIPPFRGSLGERLRASQAETAMRPAPWRQSGGFSLRAIVAVGYGDEGEAIRSAKSPSMCRIRWHVGPAPANRRSERAGEWRPKVHSGLVSVSHFSRAIAARLGVTDETVAKAIGCLRERLDDRK